MPERCIITIEASGQITVAFDPTKAEFYAHAAEGIGHAVTRVLKWLGRDQKWKKIEAGKA
jgi:hypothetical protein